MTVLQNSNANNIRFRKQTQGPELNLVNAFLKNIEGMFIEDGLKFSIFVEPFLDIGFPDIIAVLWNEDSLNSWSSSRLLIDRADIRILNHLNLKNYPKTIEDVKKELGYSEKFIEKSFKKLLDAQLVNNNKDFFSSKPLKDIFSPKKIIAVEAKMSKWKDAINQANLNKWFASESYVLFPGNLAREQIISETTKSEIGIIYQNDKDFIKIDSPKIDIPSSYGAWLINEWLGRSIFCKENCNII